MRLGRDPDEGLRTARLFMEINGAEGDRTLNLRIANAALSQLSYRPIFDFFDLKYRPHAMNAR